MNSETLHRLSLSDGETLSYTLRRKKRMKHLYLYVKEGELEVRCNPRVSLSAIESFLLSKEPWILRKLHEQHPDHDPAKNFPWDGRLVPIHFKEEKNSDVFRFRYEKEKDHALIQGPYFPPNDELQNLYEGYYRLHASRILGPRIEHWSEVTGLHPSKVGYRKAKSRWGSCSSRNSVNLNTRLLLCPPEIRDYVIVHELCHIRHKNHSKDFWNLVGRYLPDWKERRKRLREYERYLL